MAVIITNSNIVKAFIDHRRIRTMNHRGSLLNTSVRDDNTWGSSDANSVLYLTPIPFGASIKSLSLAYSDKTTELAFKVGIAGIEPDGTFTVIKDDLLTCPAKEQEANTWLNVWTPELTNQTLYQMLCDTTAPYLPIAAFEPYKRNEQGILFLKSTAKNNSAELKTTYAQLSWVDLSTSESPRINTSFSVLKAREAA